MGKNKILNALSYFKNTMQQKPQIRCEIKGILEKLKNVEIIFTAIFLRLYT